MTTMKEVALTAMTAAMAAPFVAGRVSGCGRVYVVLSGSKEEVNAVSAACKKVGLMFLRKAYGVSGPAVYVGYDNADGRALGKGDAFVEVLKSHGLSCYRDEVSD